MNTTPNANTGTAVLSNWVMPGRFAIGVLVSHRFGWEFRLMVGDLLRSPVCREVP